MSSKTAKLKKNVEINSARSIRQWEKDNKKGAPPSVKANFKKGFQKSAAKIESKLPYVWNDGKDNTPDNFKRRGFFGGVDFDKEGNILR